MGRDRSNIHLVSIILILFLLMSLGSTSLLWGAPAEAGKIAPLVEGAKKEGMLVAYTNTPVTSLDPLFKRFQGKYPFIKIETYRASAPRLMNKILSEAQAGAHKVDYIETEGITGYLMMKKGIFAKYISPESKAFAKGTKDPEGYWTSVYSNYKIIAYNTTLVPSRDVPKTWEDLLDEKWKEKLLMSSNDYEWFGNMLKIMGEEKGMTFMKKLAMQNPQIRVGHTLVSSLLVAGEGSIAIASNADKIEELKAKGAPVDWVGAEPVISRQHPIAVYINAPHPNAAKLFVDFSLSKEGQELVSSTFRVPDRPGIKPFAPKLAEGIRLYAADLSLADHYEEITKKFDSIFIKQKK